MAVAFKDAQYAKLKQILSATIVELCRAILSFDIEVKIDGLVGITVDQTDVLLICINEIFSQEQSSNNLCDNTTPSVDKSYQSQTQHSQLAWQLHREPSAISQPAPISDPSSQSVSSRLLSVSLKTPDPETHSSNGWNYVQKIRESEFSLDEDNESVNDMVSDDSPPHLDAFFDVPVNHEVRESLVSIKSQPINGEMESQYTNLNRVLSCLGHCQGTCNDTMSPCEEQSYEIGVADMNENDYLELGTSYAQAVTIVNSGKRNVLQMPSRARDGKFVRMSKSCGNLTTKNKNIQCTSRVTTPCPKCSVRSQTPRMVKRHLMRVHGLTPVNRPGTSMNPYYHGCTLRELNDDEKRALKDEKLRRRKVHFHKQQSNDAYDYTTLSQGQGRLALPSSLPLDFKELVESSQSGLQYVASQPQGVLLQSAVTKSSIQRQKAKKMKEAIKRYTNAKTACPKCSLLYCNHSVVKAHLMKIHGLTPVNRPLSGNNQYYPGCTLRDLNDEEKRALRAKKLIRQRTARRKVMIQKSTCRDKAKNDHQDNDSEADNGSSQCVSVFDVDRSKVKSSSSAAPSSAFSCPICAREFRRIYDIKDCLLMRHGLTPDNQSTNGKNPYRIGCSLRKATAEEICFRKRGRDIKMKVAAENTSLLSNTESVGEFPNASVHEVTEHFTLKKTKTSRKLSDSRLSDQTDHQPSVVCPMCSRSCGRMGDVKDHLLITHGFSPDNVKENGHNPYYEGCILRPATDEEFLRRFRRIPKKIVMMRNSV